jgi:hypothetical protein
VLRVVRVRIIYDRAERSWDKGHRIHLALERALPAPAHKQYE